MNSFAKRLISASCCAALLLTLAVPASIENAAEGQDSEAVAEALLKNSAEAGVSSLMSVNMAAFSPEAEEETVSTSASESVVTGTIDPSVYGYTNLGMVTVSEGNVNVRKGPDANSSIVGKAKNDNACEITGVEGDFTAITSGDVTGYIKSEYLLTGEEALQRAAEAARVVAEVTADGVNVREEASTDCDVVDNVAKGTTFVYEDEVNGFAAVEYDDDTTAYISLDYVEVKDSLPTAMTMKEVMYGSGVSSVRVDLVNYAVQFVGNPYVWGGTSLTRGADCSGFVLSIYAKYGIYLPHSSRAQANYGRRLSSTSELRPGDLLFYGGRSISHVAIYIGNGRICHASSRKTGIKISNAFYRTPKAMVSLLP